MKILQNNNSGRLLRLLIIVFLLFVILFIGRKIYYHLKYSSIDVFKVGVANTHPTPDSKYKNDLIHPSIVYIPEGLGNTGCKW